MLNTNVNSKSTYSIITIHYATGAISFLIASIMICLSLNAFSEHHFNPKLLTITHIITIGWATLIIMGALYQLLPTITNNKLYSNKLAAITYILMVTGLIILSYSFWTLSVEKVIQIATSILLIGILLFLLNIYKTADKKTSSTEFNFIITAVLWLTVTGIIGMLMAYNFEYNFFSVDHLNYLTIHAHIGILGWFILLIIGIASKLLPMFLLSENNKVELLKYSYYLINTGLILILVDGYFFNETKRIIFYILPIIVGIGLFLIFIKNVYKNRVRKKLDIPMKKSIISFIILIISIFLYITANFVEDKEIKQKIVNATGFSFLLGFITMLILGQTFKTLPFIIWLNIYKDSKERKKLPKDLYSETILKFQLPLYLMSYTFFIAGILSSIMFLLYIGGALLFLCALLYNFNVFKIILTK